MSTTTVEEAIYRLRVEGQAQVDQLKQSLDGLTVSEERQTQASRATTQSLQNRIARMDPLIKAQEQYRKELEAAQRYADAGVGTDAQRNAQISLATQRYNSQVDAIKKADDAEKGLANSHATLSTQGQAALHSMRSVAEQLYLGIPVTQALTGQMNHLSYAASGQGGIAGAFKEATGVFAGMLTPARLVVGGVAAIGAAALYSASSWSSSQKEIERSLIGIGARTGTTVAELNRFASANATATGLSIDQSRQLGIELTKTGDISVASLKGVGDAVHGYAVLTGGDATEATKKFASVLSGDLVEGARELNKSYGFLNPTIEENIRVLQRQGDRAGAIQVILDATRTDNLKAADSVDGLTKAYDALGNGLSAVKNAAGRSLDLSPLMNALSGKAIGQSGVEDAADAFAKQQNRIASEAEQVVRALTPEIDQINKLKDALARLDRAQDANPEFNDHGASTTIQNQIAALQQSQDQAARYNDRVAAISMSWGDVGQATALALQAAQNQLPVIEAVGGAAKMAAQYAADYANAINQGKTATEAAAAAAANLAAAQAQATSAAQEQLATLQQQKGVASAVTGAGQMQAQSQATYNNLLGQGVDMMTAQQVAGQQLANDQASATTSVQRQTEAMYDQNRLLRTNDPIEKARVQASIAYKNAIASGADATSAAALATETLKNGLLQAQKAAGGVAANLNSVNDAYGGILSKLTSAGLMDGLGSGSIQVGSQMASVTNYVDDNYDVTKGSFSIGPLNGERVGNGYSEVGYQYYMAGQRAASSQQVISNALTGGTDLALSTLMNTKFSSGPPQNSSLGIAPGTLWRPDIGSQSDITSAVDQLFNLKLLQAGNNNSAKASVYQQQIGYLQQQQPTIDVLTKIAQLTNSLNDLKDSTDSLTAAEQASLNPLYSGRGALAVGYYKAATGLEGIVGGSGSTDSTPVHLMLTPGEHLKVTPKGQAPSTTSNDNSKTVTVNQTFNFNNTPSKARRNARQIAQGFGQTMAAAS